MPIQNFFWSTISYTDKMSYSGSIRSASFLKEMIRNDLYVYGSKAVTSTDGPSFSEPLKLFLDNSFEPKSRLGKFFYNESGTFGRFLYANVMGRWERPMGSIHVGVHLALVFPEVVLKGIASYLSTPFSFSWDQCKKAYRDNGLKSLAFWGWGVTSLISGAINTVFAQPLFFLGNMCGHVRNLFEAGVNFISAACQGKKNDMKAAARGFGKSLAYIVAGFIAGALCFAGSAACAAAGFAPGVAFFNSMAPSLHGCIGGGLVNGLSSIGHYFANAFTNIFTNPASITKSLGEGFHHGATSEIELTSYKKIYQGISAVVSNTIYSTAQGSTTQSGLPSPSGETEQPQSQDSLSNKEPEKDNTSSLSDLPEGSALGLPTNRNSR